MDCIKIKVWLRGEKVFFFVTLEEGEKFII